MKLDPSEEIRNFDASKFDGMKVTLKIKTGNGNAEKRQPATKQMIGIENLDILENFHNPWGWITKVIGDVGQIFETELIRCRLVQNSNGGRSENQEFKTYWDYFDQSRKEKLLNQRDGGILGKMMGPRGEHNQADLIFAFDDFSFYDSCYDIKAPQEWYSLMYGGDFRFKFVDGFYETKEKALAAFVQKASDDLFGERYFPVLVFPKETEQDVIDKIIWGPKSCSEPIVTEQYVIYGTRCKSDEFEDAIGETYAAGGKVPIGLQWDWD